MTNADGQETRRGVTAKVVKELKNFFWIFLYLFIVFGFYTFADTIVLRREGQNFALHGFAVANAPVFAKVILVGERLKFGRWLNRGPLAHAIALESLAFTLLLLAFHFGERAAIGWYRQGAPHVEQNLGGGGWIGPAIVGTMVFFGLILFFAHRNLSRAMGPDRLYTLLFRARDAA